MSHIWSRRRVSCVISGGEASPPRSAKVASPVAIRSAMPRSSSAWYSTSSDACRSGTKPAGSTELASAPIARMEAASMSSTTSAPERTRCGSAVVAASSESNSSRPVAVRAGTGTVWKTASATKPSVPSEPIMRCSRIRTGLSWSRNEFRP